jgi:hypothetical protein
MTTRCLATDSLMLPRLIDGLAEAEVNWETACHVTATGSLAKALRMTGVPAIPIATLLDLVLLPHWDSTRERADARQFPTRAVLAGGDEVAVSGAMKGWRRTTDRLRFRLGFDLSRALRSYARETLQWSAEARILIAGRQEFFRSIESLETSGFSPRELTPASAFQEVALRAWSELRGTVPNLAAGNQLLWGPRKNEAAASLSDALAHVFSSTGAVAQVVMHGFYFYTPPQWALFQLLDASPSTEQILLIHDDGSHPAYSTWRQFFARRDWRLPSIEQLTAPVRSKPERDACLSNALGGQPFSPGDLDRVSATTYRNVAEFVTDVTTSSEPSALYAPGHAEVEAYILRLGRPEDNDRIDLSDLPIGVYILNLHSMVELRPGESPRVRVSEAALRDVLSSGYLPVALPQPVALTSVVERALPFFEGCDLGHEWVERSLALARLVRGEVAELGVKSSGATDADRITTQAANPLRVVPWADLTIEEADALHICLRALVDAARDIADVERVQMREYLADLRRRLREGMGHLSAAETEEILGKLDSAGDLDEEQVGVHEVVEVVRVLLGRSAGGPYAPGDEDDAVAAGDREDEGSVRPLRELDVLAYRPSEIALHLTNLSDRSFPRAPRVVGWPFRLSDLQLVSNEERRISHDILRAREEQSGLSDTYLLHLALGASHEGGEAQRLRFSHFEQLRGNPLNRSPLIQLLVSMYQDHEAPAVRAYMAGLVPDRSTPNLPAKEGVPPFAPTARGGPSVPLDLDRRALAVAAVCKRRFALQWIFGPTASMRAGHHFSILYGNVLRSLEHLGKSHDPAIKLCDDLWRFMTRGQRESSRRRARVSGRNVTAWFASMGYSREAYGIAKGESPAPTPDELRTPGMALLPEGVSDPAVCKHCPVKDRCLQAARG